jgi:hypothetical protein
MRREFWLENLKGRYYSRDLGVNVRIILKVILRNMFGEVG